MKKHCLYLFIAGAIVFIASCDQPTTTTTAGTNNRDTAAATFDLAKARQWIESENAKFMEEAKRGDSNALAAHYTSDAWLMFDNSEPFKGADIAKAWGAAIRMGMKDLKVTTSDVVGGPEVLAETGTYEMYGQGNKLFDKGKYVVVWKTENNGWKIYRDIANSNMPQKK